jgi:hypothetical protein
MTGPSYGERLADVYRLLDRGDRADVVRNLKSAFSQVQSNVDTRNLDTAEHYALYLRGLTLALSERAAVLHDAVRALRVADAIELDTFPGTEATP